MSSDSYVTKVCIDVCRKAFYLYSNEGEVKELLCETQDQFFDVRDVVEFARDYDLEIVYVDPLVANAGVM